MQPDAWTDDSDFRGESYWKPSPRGVWSRGPRLSVQVTMVMLGLIVLFRSTGVNGALFGASEGHKHVPVR